MDSTFSRNSQDKLRIWWVRTNILNNGLFFDLNLMIYAFKAQSFPFWLKNKKETCKWRHRRSSVGSDTGSMASSACWAKWSSNSNMSQWAMSKGTRGKTEVNNDENYMFCISQHACQNNPINWTILVARNLMQLFRRLDCWRLPSLLSAQGEQHVVQCYTEVMSVSQAVALTCFSSSQLPSAFGNPLTELWNAPLVPSFKLCIVFTRLYLVPFQYSA